jgi:hypothetical protein
MKAKFPASRLMALDARPKEWARRPELQRILQPTIHFDDLQRIGRGHQDLREQSVRIERDRGEQLVELFGFEN